MNSHIDSIPNGSFWTYLQDCPRRGHRRVVLCRCVCGTERAILWQSVRTSKSKSCGCKKKDLLNVAWSSIEQLPASHHRLRHIWEGMRKRCEDSDVKCYPRYGGRGIRVCQEWQDFATFKSWAMANGYASHLTLDRYPDNNGNYGPDNCRWATNRQQCRNTRRNVLLAAFGETKTVVEWLEDPRCVVTEKCLYRRVSQGMDHEKAISFQPEPKLVDAFSESKTVKQWAADSRCSVSWKILWQRLYTYGFEPEFAITEPTIPHRLRRSA